MKCRFSTLFAMLVLMLSEAANGVSDPYQPTEITDALYAQVLKAREARMNDNVGIAVSLLEAIVKSHPDYFLARYNLGLAYDAVNRRDDAISQLEAAK